MISGKEKKRKGTIAGVQRPSAYTGCSKRRQRVARHCRRLDDTSLHRGRGLTPGTEGRSGNVSAAGRRLLIPFGMRSAAVAGLCRVSTNRVELFVLCPYKVIPRDRRKAAGNRASPSFGGGVRNHSRFVVRATRPPSTGTLRHRPRGPAVIDSPGRMHTGPGPLGARPFHENYRNRSALLPPKREFEVHISSINSTVVDFISFYNRYIL